MPKNYREFHRFLNIGEKIAGQKAILGSFSVAHLTHYADGTSYTLEKELKLDFFYGSKPNKFWHWYKCHLDAQIDPCERESILRSLRIHKIAITDIISSCEREGYSALDNSLKAIVWNHEGITQLINNGVNIFLCTSKWVMQKLYTHILRKMAFLPHPMEASQLQQEIFPFLKNKSFLHRPLVQVYQLADKRIVTIALPTPGGGTFRMLDTFGYNPTLAIQTGEFLNLYLAASFNYFMA